MCKDKVRSKVLGNPGEINFTFKDFCFVWEGSARLFFICKTMNTPFPLFGIFSLQPGSHPVFPVYVIENGLDLWIFFASNLVISDFFVSWYLVYL